MSLQSAKPYTGSWAHVAMFKEILHLTKNHSEPAPCQGPSAQPRRRGLCPPGCSRVTGLHSSLRRQEGSHEGRALPREQSEYGMCPSSSSLAPSLPLSSFIPITTSQARYSLPSPSLHLHVPSHTLKHTTSQGSLNILPISPFYLLVLTVPSTVICPFSLISTDFFLAALQHMV